MTTVDGIPVPQGHAAARGRSARVRTAKLGRILTYLRQIFVLGPATSPPKLPAEFADPCCAESSTAPPTAPPAPPPPPPVPALPDFEPLSNCGRQLSGSLLHFRQHVDRSGTTLKSSTGVQFSELAQQARSSPAGILRNKEQLALKLEEAAALHREYSNGVVRCFNRAELVLRNLKSNLQQAHELLQQIDVPPAADPAEVVALLRAHVSPDLASRMEQYCDTLKLELAQVMADIDKVTVTMQQLAQNGAGIATLVASERDDSKTRASGRWAWLEIALNIREDLRPQTKELLDATSDHVMAAAITELGKVRATCMDLKNGLECAAVVLAPVLLQQRLSHTKMHIGDTLKEMPTVARLQVLD